MKIIDLPQGSALWLQHRREHFNASDAPAMMGCSPYKTRGELMRELATGVSAEVDAGTQSRFSDGHRFEALARPLAEALLSDDLYAITVVGVDGRLSASLDGATLDGKTLFEHKTLTAELRDAIVDEDMGEQLPLHYRVQMEQQLYCADAERVLFMATKWEGEKCIGSRHCWYYPNPTLRAQILAGWNQFAEDLAAYTPPAAATAVVAEAMESLPAVSVRMDGTLAVQSNLPAFGLALRAFIDRLPTKPATDTEFATAEAACKALKKAEDALDAAENGALASMSDVEAMRRSVADFRELARSTRLATEKLVAARKTQIREEEVQRGRSAFADYFKTQCHLLGGPYLTPMTPDFGGAIKGLKTLDSVRDKIDTTLAQAKIECSAQADKVRANISTVGLAADGNPGAENLFPDLANLVQKAPDDLAAVIAQRLAALKAANEKTAEAAREAERKRLEAAATPPAATPAIVTTAPPQPIATSGPAPSTKPTLRLSDIAERLGLIVGEKLLSRLGFDATHDRTARLYQESAFPLICARLAAHIAKVGEEHSK